MAEQTVRETLDAIMALARRALRYWWLVAIAGVLGGAISVFVALSIPRNYVSEARLLHNERIDSSLLQGREMGYQMRSLGTRYGELLLSRPELARVIDELGLLPEVVAGEGMDAAVEDLSKLITFRTRGAGMFHIQFVSPDPHVSQAVTARLTELLIEKDRRYRRENAETTRRFLLAEKAQADRDLAERMKAFAAFLAEHPEFAEDLPPGQQATAGAGVRAVLKDRENGGGAASLTALERQRRRILERLSMETPALREAGEVLRKARQEVAEAESQYTRLRERFTASHPDVVRASALLERAKQRLAEAEAVMPREPPPIAQRALEDELADVERQIAETEARGRQARGIRSMVPALVTRGDGENWVVALETEFSRLSQDVAQARHRVNKIDTSLSNAELVASQQMAEEGDVLTVIDPANLPARPAGRGRFIIVAAGTGVFMVMGLILALGLALIDDRIYALDDLKQLGIAPPMAVIPRLRTKKRGSRG